jgi:hypothetical protein
MAGRPNDPDRLEADQRLQETRDALRTDMSRNSELQNIADVVNEDDLEEMDVDGVDPRKS